MKWPKACKPLEVLEAAGQVKEPGRAPAPAFEDRTRTRKTTLLLKGGWSVTLLLPCCVKSEANERCHWAVRRQRFTDQATTLLLEWLGSPLQNPPGLRTQKPMQITFIHVGRKMDSDNLAGAFKGLRDMLAKLVGLDDGDDRLTWVYTQRPGKGGVEVKIESA